MSACAPPCSEEKEEKRSWAADAVDDENVPRRRKMAEGFSFDSLDECQGEYKAHSKYQNAHS